MQPPRFTYILLFIATIVLGLLSRHFTFFPLFIGDIIWASMVYFLFRFIFINTGIKCIILCSLLFSFAIEFSQLYTASWIMHLRQTLFGKLVLGATFNLGDLLCYTTGIFIAAGINLFIANKNLRIRGNR